MGTKWCSKQTFLQTYQHDVINTSSTKKKWVIQKKVMKFKSKTTNFFLKHMHQIYLNLLLHMVVYFSLLPLISHLDVNKLSNIIEHILGFIRAVSWSAQNAELHWMHVHITLTVEHFSFHAFCKKRGLQLNLISCSSHLNVTKMIKIWEWVSILSPLFWRQQIV